ncbi:MAG: tRNA uridine(34) 5-carboxymethylaminomethyl modification radical SAM/GNAT enzyme Elp3 [Patescibacteria group bacterium]|mgnify:CR=1 FL=1
MPQSNLHHRIIREALRLRVTERGAFLLLARSLSREMKHPMPSISSVRQALLHYTAKIPTRQREALLGLLHKRNIRSLSGVAIITALTKPFPCPGRCTYCPTEARMPKSYLSNEPAAARALALKFDPYIQVQSRIRTLEDNGHPTDKIELIIKGGTWSSYPARYQSWFIQRCFEAANGAPSPFPLPGVERVHTSLPRPLPAGERIKVRGFEKEQVKNEKARHRIIGLTIETRPDWITLEEIVRLRKLGCTRVELGVQTTHEDILKRINRDHGIAEVERAAVLLREAGFKMDFHLMPQLPGATPRRDYEMIKEIFENENLRPDMVKIYPCLVLPNALLYAQYKRGLYKPYSDRELAEMLIRAKSELIPRYCRISRLIRDIPGNWIMAGNTMTNMREYIQAEMRKRGLKCKCLRCREIGHQNPPQSPFSKGGRKGDLKVFIDEYAASGGREYFLSIEDPERETVYAFCRLRLPAGSHPELYHDLPEIKGAALIRELHTYGHLVSLKRNNRTTGQRNNSGEVQHTGLGRALMQRAEEIAHEQGFQKMAVISGVGVRDYYRKLGYRHAGTYMIKFLQ